MAKILKLNDTSDYVLRERALPVHLQDLKTKKIADIKNDMLHTLKQEKYGVAIAAPQIGVSLQIFLIPSNTFAHAKNEEIQDNRKDEFFFNPEIIKHSKKTVESDEGCLSVPGIYSYHVPRYEKITMRYIDSNGQTKTINASGFLARVLQHEYDHLQGVLYIDRAKSTVKVDENLKPIQ